MPRLDKCPPSLSPRLQMRRWSFVLLAALINVNTVEASVILLYHRVSETGAASTRVEPQRFADHLDLISQQGYRVMPLLDVLTALRAGVAPPEKTVVITFDDAYRSVGEVAFPLLKARGMPFTIFAATDIVDAANPHYLSWEALQEMATNPLVTVGGHSLSHAHLESLDAVAGDLNDREFSGDTGRPSAQRGEEVALNMQRLKQKLGSAVVEAFAYPFGEYSRSTEALLTRLDLAGLAQQSGAIGSATNLTRIPRFPLHMGADSDARLLLALQSKPLEVLSEQPAQIFYPPNTELPATWRLQPVVLGFSRAAIQCYSSRGNALPMRWLADDWLEVDLPTLTPGRNKVNCTAPAQDGSGYFWTSRLWVVADSNGQWLLN